MREEVRLTIIALVLIFGFNLAILSTFLPLNPSPLLSPEIESIIPIPTNCSASNITSLWNAIFQVSSTDISIQTNQTIPGKCRFFLANKTVNRLTYILIGEDISTQSTYSSLNHTRISALRVNFTATGQSQFDSFSASPKNTEDEYNYFGRIFSVASYQPAQAPITSTVDAYNLYNTIFKIANTTEFNLVEEDSSFYVYLDYTKIINGNNYTSNSLGGGISNVSELQILNAEKEIYFSNPCIQNWTVLNTSCSSAERITFFYNDTKSCQNTTGQPENYTHSCDYDENGIIAHPDNISTNMNLNITIDNIQLNVSREYNETKTIKVMEGNITRISMNYNFNTPLDFSSLTITKQSSSSSKGYLIISGLEGNKTIKIDKLNSTTNAVCIKDTSTGDAVSTNCESTNEYQLSCPGNSENYSCSVSGSLITISGIKHSIVKEFRIENFPIPSCTPLWNCTGWSACNELSIQTKNCTDLNNCNVLTGRPLLVQSCTPSPACVPSWNCTGWEECRKDGTQIQTCVDLNNCSILTGKPPELQDCEYKSRSLLLIIVVLICLICLTALAIFIYLYKKKSSDIVIESKPASWQTSTPLNRSF